MAGWLKRALCAAVAALLPLALALPVQAGGGLPEETEETRLAQAQATLELNVKSAILMEQSTGRVLYESNPDEKMAPASITKIMTLLLTMEAIEAGKLALTDLISCSEYASSMGGSQIWLEPGEQMSVDDLLKATAVFSANDAAVLLAEASAGSEEGFVVLMNQRAAELGMKNTTFQNASGLDEPGHMTTARDIALMSCELLRHDIIREYSTIWMDNLRDGATQLVNTNKLVRFYEGATGLKTGTTNGAGSCLSATAERSELSLVAVVLGAPTSDERFAGARKLLDHGFANYAMVAPPEFGDQLLPVRVLGGVGEQVAVECDPPSKVVVRQGEEERLRQNIQLSPDVSAPVERGQTLGKAVLTLDGVVLAEVDLKAAESVASMTFFRAFGKLLTALVTF